jgi:hypothetical protein
MSTADRLMRASRSPGQPVRRYLRSRICVPLPRCVQITMPLSGIWRPLIASWQALTPWCSTKVQAVQGLRLYCTGDQNSRPAVRDYVQMQPMPLEHWMEIAVLETLLDTWLEHKGARDPAYAALDREFRSALGPDFDISVFDSLDSAHLVESKYIRKRGLAKGTTARNDVKRRHLKDLRCEWNATQSMGLRDGQRMLEFQSLAQRYL